MESLAPDPLGPVDGSHSRTIRRATIGLNPDRRDRSCPRQRKKRTDRYPDRKRDYRGTPYGRPATLRIHWLGSATERHGNEENRTVAA